ncbi:IPT/TIG domain-containing protein [Bacteroides caecimuris]|uniref:IPT/TIG domain-containing protein n=1 Tax=Bacteroides caecimuris TaxID=1796613 RepID=UPI0025724233|nr:IPT/TIG domain-containing protein [Bacteroides caecimuris]
MKMRMKNHACSFLWGMLALISFCFVGCKDDDEGGKRTPFDPSKPVVISDFTPKEGGWGARLLLYGDNFGDDPAKVKVTIGGKEAKVITVTNENLYCFVPRSADAGNIEVTILDEHGEELAYGEADEIFQYKKKYLASTLVGETYENNTKFDIMDGPWGNCGGLEKMEWMAFDPNNPDMLYVCGGGKAHRVVNFADQTLGTIKFTGEASGNTNVLSFTKDGQLMVVRDISQDGKNGIFFYSPESNFQTQVKAIHARGCRAAAAHPINGEIYTTRYDKGWIGRYEPETGDYKMDEIQMPYASIECYIAIHPTGQYMYIMVRNKHIIYRADYDFDEKTFTTPYLVCGRYEDKNFKDGVGGNVRLNQPQQGCFVKNEEYAGQKDEYDFYFVDKMNHCVRTLTPTGRVKIYAGRPNGDGATGFNDGDLRKEARFFYPASIVWDEKRECLLIGDSDNHRIRKIAMED